MANSADLEGIFFAALARETTARAAFLEQTCRHEPETRGEVERLLAAHARLDDFLEQPPTAVATAAKELRALAPGIRELDFLGPPTLRVPTTSVPFVQHNSHSRLALVQSGTPTLRRSSRRDATLRRINATPAFRQDQFCTTLPSHMHFAIHITAELLRAVEAPCLAYDDDDF